VYVTHDQEEAMTMADRIVILNDGKLQQIGAPKQVYHEPTNYFVADFIGSPSMNFLDVELERHPDGSGTITSEDFSYDVSSRLLEPIDSSTSDLIFGIRPEDVRIEPQAPPEKTVELTVDVVEIVGSDNFVYLDLAGKGVPRSDGNPRSSRRKVRSSTSPSTRTTSTCSTAVPRRHWSTATPTPP